MLSTDVHILHTCTDMAQGTQTHTAHNTVHKVRQQTWSATRKILHGNWSTCTHTDNCDFTEVS